MLSAKSTKKSWKKSTWQVVNMFVLCWSCLVSSHIFQIFATKQINYMYPSFNISNTIYRLKRLWRRSTADNCALFEKLVCVSLHLFVCIVHNPNPLLYTKIASLQRRLFKLFILPLIFVEFISSYNNQMIHGSITYLTYEIYKCTLHEWNYTYKGRLHTIKSYAWCQMSENTVKVHIFTSEILRYVY